LRSIPADKVLAAWKEGSKVTFEAIVDGWVVPEQPAKIFAEGKQLKIPVLVGSNADEATVFGLVAPKTVLSEWPAYTVREDQYLELGRKVALRQVPERLKTLEQIMASVIGDTTGSATGSLSTN
jgi:carboxylesterase type B